MGLLDKVTKLGKKVISDVTSDESKEKAKEFIAGVPGFMSEVAKGVAETAKDVKEYVQDAVKDDEPVVATTTQEPVNQTACSNNEDTCDGTCNCTCREKLLKLLAKEFPQYTVKENVSPTTIGGTGKFMNYSIGVYSAETPKLFIMVIGKTTCAHREYRWSKQEAAKNGITMINFVDHYPNERDYIVNRLHKYL